MPTRIVRASKRKEPRPKPAGKKRRATARSTPSKRRRSGTKKIPRSLGGSHLGDGVVSSVPLNTESTDNRPIIPVNHPIAGRDSEPICEIDDMDIRHCNPQHSALYPHFITTATETVCYLAQEEAKAVGNGARWLYKALAGLGVGTIILVSACLALTAFKANDSQAMQVAASKVQIPDIELPIDLQVIRLLRKPLPVAYGIPAIRDHFSGSELKILAEVAHDYGLDRNQTLLLFAIRRVEAGRPGCEMGCGDEIPNHPAKRYAGNFEKSLRLQACYSSGTIRNHWDGDFRRFARIYCPRRPTEWSRNISQWVGVLASEKTDNDF